MKRRRNNSVLTAAVMAVTLCGTLASRLHAQERGATKVDIRSLSSRPEMISGGDALVRIALPDRSSGNRFSVRLNERDVTSVFRVGQEPDALVGRVTGLQPGRNEIDVTVPGGHGRLTLVNHSITGPIISGPHQKPFVCETEALGLGPPLDSDCSIKTRVDYFYRSTAGAAVAAGPAGLDSNSAGSTAAFSAWKRFDPAAPRPTDLAMTTTSEGRTVPFIVRREMGTINRAVYLVAFLHEPGQPLPSPWNSTSAWNGRLLYSFGGGCAAGYRQGGTAWPIGGTIGALLPEREHLEDGSLGEYPLATGYAIAGATLNVFGTSCNDVISAETLMMVKEYFVEQFGMPRYTIGSGSSGGSMQVHLIGNNYPGLLDGIRTMHSFADAMTFLTPLFDCELLDHAIRSSPAALVIWTTEQKRSVSGHRLWDYCTRNGGRFPNLRAATNFYPKVIPADIVYHPENNPTGARFTFHDNLVNVFGRDTTTGFARRPFDNVGIQYGLGAFNGGKISFDQFLDLNARIGGHDIDGHIVAARTVADPEALRIAYRTGRVNDASRGLSGIPIVDTREYMDNIPDLPDVHDIAAGAITRARLIAANGHADNLVSLTYPHFLQIPEVRHKVNRHSLDLLDRWLSAIKGDTTAATTELQRVARQRAAAADACFSETGEKILDSSRCREMFPVFANPRLVAGVPATADILKCQLKPLDQQDYARPLTSAQVASLRAVFPNGVCDYSRKGVAQRAPDTWLSFGDGGAVQSR